MKMSPRSSENPTNKNNRTLARAPAGIVFNEHTDEDGATVFRHACKLGLEGIVSKRLSTALPLGSVAGLAQVKNPDSPAMVRARAGVRMN
jgi:hypothetical protein